MTPKHPTPNEIRALREKYNITRQDAGKLIYMNGRAFEKWETGARKMHPALFELLKLKLELLYNINQ